MSEPSHDQRTIDRLLVRSIARWAAVLAVLIAAFDLAILRGYPFPGGAELLRGVFYTLFGLVVLLGTLFVTFLGYRIATMHIARDRKTLYLIFLPAMFAIGSVVGFLYLAAPA
jgi:hypothetical protein